MISRSTSRLPLICAVLTLAISCGGTTDPTTASVAGSYGATAFTTTTNGVSTNELARKATLDLVLSANGTVTGALHIPADASNPTLDADMAGTWTLNGNTVTFSQSADTFVRDMPFTVGDKTLTGDKTFGPTRIQVTLTRP